MGVSASGLQGFGILELNPGRSVALSWNHTANTGTDYSHAKMQGTGKGPETERHVWEKPRRYAELWKYAMLRHRAHWWSLQFPSSQVCGRTRSRRPGPCAGASGMGACPGLCLPGKVLVNPPGTGWLTLLLGAQVASPALHSAGFSVM